MRNALLQTLVSVLLASLVLFIILLPGMTGLAVLAPILLLFCAPFPTYVAVLIHQLVTKRIFPGNKVYTVLSGIAMLLVIYHFGLIIYIVIVRDEPLYELTDIMMYEYTREFLLPNICAGSLAISVPLAEIVIDKIKSDLKKYQGN